METPIINQVSYDFDSSNSNWENIPDYNHLFIRSQENYANDLLIVNGFVTVNEVLDMLGITRTAEGINSGWVKSHGRINFRTEDYADKIVVTLYVQDNINQAI